ncbi:hypothetical protein, partial [Xanthomonas campestris]|uniref:hypothetical protein n=1 Tax=Xanthomonas campestris TaxID=339 RepID=UPI0039C1FA75
ARVGLFDKPDDLLGAESALLHVRPLGFTDFIASAGTAQWGQVTVTTRKSALSSMSLATSLTRGSSSTTRINGSRTRGIAFHYLE